MREHVAALWCSGSCSRLVIRGSWDRIPLGAYVLRQGILSTIVSLDPGVVNGYPAGIYSLQCLWWAPTGSSAKAGVNMSVMMYCAVEYINIGTAQYKCPILLLLLSNTLKLARSRSWFWTPAVSDFEFAVRVFEVWLRGQNLLRPFQESPGSAPASPPPPPGSLMILLRTHTCHKTFRKKDTFLPYDGVYVFMKTEKG